MDEDNKLPLKRVELSLTKFNEVAIPHHLDLLRQHKTNIIKYEAMGSVSRARSEQARARRVAAQLRALLLEMDALRRQVQEQDRARFDALTQRSRDTTLRAIVDYLGTSPLAINRGPAASDRGEANGESVGVLHEEGVVPLDDPEQVQLHVGDELEELEGREALLRGWAELQAEVRALHDVWQHAQAAALAQRAALAAGAQRVDVAADNVLAARGHLSAAERWRAGAVGVSGACVGALVGGPVGLLVGAKAGALGAAAGSLLGYLGVRALGRRALPPAPAPAPPDHKDKEQ